MSTLHSHLVWLGVQLASFRVGRLPGLHRRLLLWVLLLLLPWWVRLLHWGVGLLHWRVGVLPWQARQLLLPCRRGRRQLWQHLQEVLEQVRGRR